LQDVAVEVARRLQPVAEQDDVVEVADVPQAHGAGHPFRDMVDAS
jgi:hypothetical protein